MPESVKISELPVLASVASNDVVPIVDAAFTQTSRCTASQIAAIGGGPPGDNTVSTGKLQNGAVTYPKIQNVTGDRVLGRTSGTSGPPQEIECTAFARSLLAAANGSAARLLINDSAVFTGTLTVNGDTALNGNADIQGNSTVRGERRSPIGAGSTLYREFGARAWACFDMATSTLRAGGNVTSVTRSAQGKARVNFAVPMPDTNYCILVTAKDVAIGGNGVDGFPNDADYNTWPVACINHDTPKTAEYCEVLSNAAIQAGSDGLYDSRDYYVVIFR